MKIADAMTKHVETIPAGTSIKKAAKKMRELDTGFLPVTDTGENSLVGVTTDRDIVVRCVAGGKDPSSAPVEEVMSEKVLYCFAGDDLDSAARSMAEQQVYRLVVLDAPESKQLAGVITVADMRRQGAEQAADEATQNIVEAA